METVNAKISGTTLGIEDHGVLTFFVFLEWRGSGQGLGKIRVGSAPGLVAIRKILETVGVEKWEDLKGQLVRAKIGTLGSSRPPIIGHIMEDKWFDLKEFMETNKG